MNRKREDINLSTACVNRIRDVLAEAIVREIVSDAIKEVNADMKKAVDINSLR